MKHYKGGPVGLVKGLGMKKRSATPRATSDTTTPVNQVVGFFTTGISRTLNPSLLGWQALMLMITVFAFVVIGGFVGLSVFLISLLAASTGFLPLALFIILFGLVIGLLLLMAVNAFVDGVHYHLAMQAIARKPIDFDLAWKLSSARWKDALVVQGSVVAMILAALLVSALASVLIYPPANGLNWLMNPAQWVDVLGVPFIIILALLVAMQPFLFLLLPSVYFESASPAQVLKRLFHYVKPAYWILMLAGLGVIVFNVVIGSLADWVTTLLSTGTNPLTVVAMALAATLIQLGAFLFTFSATVSIQTTAYLHRAKPKESVQFVSSGFVSRALASMARNKPHHSGRLPVKWKSPRRR